MIKMEPQGQKSAPSPSDIMADMLAQGAKKQEELHNIEKQLYEMETSYLQDPSHCGNVLKGYEPFLSSKSTTILKRPKKFQAEDRLFSLSSVTSTASEEIASGRDGGGVSIGQGKPKKGRPAGGTRDGRRMRQSHEADVDYEDDPDLI
ncbi:hypothetical protein LguiA_020507 [Lonicera macranthoides]